MFTGLVEEIGKIESIRMGAASCVLTIGCKEVIKDSTVGDSIAVNGICLTVTDIGSSYFTADVMPETMKRSALSMLSAGSPVNLERAMPADGRFGGHIVSGHIDGTGTIKSIRRDDNAVWYEVETDAQILRYIVEKGSICIDGISLTVAYADAGTFRVSIIPHTIEVTALKAKKVGDPVNLECDIIGKYVEKLMTTQPASVEKSRITEEFLIRNGF